MKKTLYFFLIISLTFFIASVNPVINTFFNGVNAQDTTPEEYSIKKGDTLWDISNSKLQDPFLWPNLWRVNPQIKNPDLIFPGDNIKIPSKEELMRLPAMPEEKPPVVAEPIIPEEEPAIEVPIEKPKQYIVNKKLYISSGWISDEFPSIGDIINAPTNHTLFGLHDLVYLKTTESVAAGDKFFAIRAIKKVKHPKTGELLGRQIRITGILEVIGMDSNVPKAKITASFEDLLIGDGLMPYSEMEPPVVPDTVRTPDIKGYIVESHMNPEMISAGDIAFLDKGQNDGLEVGDTFSAFSHIPVKRSTGMIQVISLQSTTSAAVILKSDQEITIGDMWGGK